MYRHGIFQRGFYVSTGMGLSRCEEGDNWRAPPTRIRVVADACAILEDHGEGKARLYFRVTTMYISGLCIFNLAMVCTDSRRYS